MSLLSHFKRRLELVNDPQLNWKQRLRFVPLLGDGLLFLNNLLKLNRFRAITSIELEQLQIRTAQLQQELSQQASSQQASVTALQEQTMSALHELRQTLAVTQQALQTLTLRHQQLEQRYLRQSGIWDQRYEQLFQQQHTLPAFQLAKPDQNSSKDEIDTDQFYRDFERVFRGSESDIKQRLQVYLPYLQQAQSLNPANNRVLDIGCGRGEWLSLLQEHGYQGTGVDSNRAMVERCIEVGRQAIHDDAISYLRRHAGANFLAISGFHIVEHIPFKQLLELFDAALAALAPNGIVIFETPNPENVLVGSCYFYSDPTHLHPLVPNVLAFMLEQRGFAKTQIHTLHPVKADQHFSGEGEVITKLNHLFYGPQDYAAIAWKSHAV